MLSVRSHRQHRRNSQAEAAVEEGAWRIADVHQIHPWYGCSALFVTQILSSQALERGEWWSRKWLELLDFFVVYVVQSHAPHCSCQCSPTIQRVGMHVQLGRVVVRHALGICRVLCCGLTPMKADDTTSMRFLGGLAVAEGSCKPQIPLLLWVTSF